MTPEQLAELHEVWSGPWRKTSDGGAYQYELPPLASRWEPTAGTIPWTGNVVLRLRRPGHATFAAEGATFTAAVEKLRGKLDDYAAGLRSLAAELPTPRTRMTPARLAELNAAWPGPWRRVDDQDDVADDYELPPNADGYSLRASIVPDYGDALLILRRGDHATRAWTGKTFAACVDKARSELAAEGHL